MTKSNSNSNSDGEDWRATYGRSKKANQTRREMGIHLSQAGDLAARRKAVGLTQSQLAQLCRCSFDFVAKVENGYRPERSPTMGQLLYVLKDLESQQELASGRFDQVDGGVA